MSYLEIEYEGKTFSKSLEESASEIDIATLPVALIEVDTRTTTSGPSTGAFTWGQGSGLITDQADLVAYVASHTGSTNPAGANQNVQFNDNGAFGASPNFIFDKTTNYLSLNGSFQVYRNGNILQYDDNGMRVDGFVQLTQIGSFGAPSIVTTDSTGLVTRIALNTSGIPENTNLYFTETRVRGTVLAGLNITGGNILATDSLLTAFGKLQNQISGLLGGATYQSVWNASTNSPSLSSGTGTKGYYYIVSVAGSTNLDGITDWKVGDWAIYNGSAWNKVDNTDAVSSVNGFTGAVSLTTADVSEVTNQYFTQPRVRSTTISGAGYAAGAGTVGASDTALTAIQKLDGNIAARVVATRLISATSPVRINGAGSADLSADRTISWDFTVSNNWAGQNYPISAIATAVSNAINAINPTAAAVGAQQNTPAITLGSQGWKTNATAGSQPITWTIIGTPVQGAANPTSYLAFYSNINAAGLTNGMQIFSDGSITLGHASGVINNTSVTVGPVGGASGNLFCQRILRGNSSVNIGATGGNSITTTAGTSGLTSFGNASNLSQLTLGAAGEVRIGSAAVASNGWLQFPASTTLNALMLLTVGVAPTTPIDGQVWREDNTNTGLKIRVNGVTKTFSLV